MIPLRDVIPSRTTPWKTLLLLALNALAFAATLVLPAETRQEILVQYGLPVESHPWVTSATSLFLHASSIPLAINLAALWLFGENVEDRFGHARYLVFCLGVGYLAGLAELWSASGTRPPSGAAAAVAAVLGAYLMMFPRSRLLVAVPTGLPLNLIEMPAVAFIAGWFLLHMATGTPALLLLMGAAAGVLGSRMLRRPERQRVEWWAK
jgi:membrane associated rhomboid family serine protease